jgi:glycosyltransferase involved in cell wall biosynthesis
MKRILITLTDCEIGGFTTHTCNLGRAFRRMGHHVSALVFEPFGAGYPDLCQALDEVILLRRRLETRVRFLERIIGEIETVAPNVLINNDTVFTQAALPFVNQNIVRISVVHNIVEREIRIALTEREYLDWVIAVSENVADGIRLFAPDWPRVRTIPVGVELATPVRRDRPVGAPVRLLFLGRLVPQKNLPGLLCVLDHFHASDLPFELTVIGDGPEEPWLKSQVARRRYRNSVVMKGAIPPSQVRGELAAQDVLLMTSRFEGTPHVVLEAMGAGLVAICSNLPGSTDRIIENGVNGFLCDPDAPETYGRVLAELRRNPEYFRSVSVKAVESIKTQYNAQAIADRYDWCMANPAPRPLVRGCVQLCSRAQLPAGLRPYYVGIVGQTRHRLADIWKRFAQDRIPICPGKIGR